MGYIGEREELQRRHFEPLPDERDLPAEPSPDAQPAAEPAREPVALPAGRVAREWADDAGQLLDACLYGDVFVQPPAG